MGSISVQWKVRIFLIALFIVGIILLVLSPHAPWNWLVHLATEFGIALLIAAILGLTVDWALKAELARDVFHAAFNYVLPEELKEEVSRVINYKFLCKKCYTVVEIVPMEGDFVKVIVSFERVINNITRHSETIEPGANVDEWGVTGHSSGIDYYKAEYNGQEWNGVAAPDGPGGRKNVRINGGISIPRDGNVKITGKYYEIRRKNDATFIAWNNPTVNPRICVRLPIGFDHTCSFGIPGEKIEPSGIEKLYELRGTQFPGQETKIRWWQIAESNSLVSSPSK